MVRLDNKFKPEYGTSVYFFSIAGILAALIVCFGISAVTPEGNVGEIVEKASGLVFQIFNLAVFSGFILYKKTRPDIFLLPRQGADTAKGGKKRIVIFCAAGLAFGVICLIFFAPLSYAGQNLLAALGYKLSPPYKRGIPLQDVFLLLVTIVAAPVCEELIYRSALTSGLKKKFNDYITAVLVGLAFALMHMNPEQTIYQFFLGFGSTLLALSSGFVLPSVIMHAASNLIAALDIIGVTGFTHFFGWYEKLFKGFSFGQTAAAFLLAAAGVAVFVFGAWLLKKYAGRVQAADPKQQTEQAEEREPERLSPRGIGQNESFFTKHRVMLLYFLGLAVSLFVWISLFIFNLA